MSVDYAAVVAEGIQLLDAREPGWQNKIDVSGLDLGSCSVCVLGQVFGDYDDGKKNLGLTTNAAARYGFRTDYSYPELTKAWKDALGKNKVLVEKGDIYTDLLGCCGVRVFGTEIVSLGDKTVTVYLIMNGSVTDGVFKQTGTVPQVFRKSEFEKGGTHPRKLESFQFKKGQLVTNNTGKVYYVLSEFEAREVKDDAMAVLTSAIDRQDLREVRTYSGKKFTDTMK